jgi:hypothetical protein
MTSSSTATPNSWARVWAAARPFARPMPRAGAWYPVVGEASGNRVVLQVGGRRVAVPKNLLEIRTDQPHAFTVVCRSRAYSAELRDALGTEVARLYAVCPVCAERLLVVEPQPMATCGKCGHHANVAWWETG